ncbi:MAG TPA: DUF429 domain-containing protein [Thermoanaerobaculia bacterium]|nr:DUF429 domain-containing protein [Thermoanaerobaculia bacterium]
MTPIRLIGADWSAEETKRGIAVVDYANDTASLVALSGCSAKRKALRVMADALAVAPGSCVIAIDAPLGWPVAMAQALAEHAAGESLPKTASEMFSRDTDRFVQTTLTKRPLEVGTNLIARTAHSANQFLRVLREETRRPIPLLWSPDELSDAGVIEVYPAATKRAIAPQSATDVLGLDAAAIAGANAHVADALWCAVAALHFVRGECAAPLDPITSRREGWIWFRRPQR